MFRLPVMKWLPRAAAAIAVGLLALPVCGREAKHPEKPLLWRIEGNGLKKPGYLFGTIHLSNPVIAQLHPAAAKAFESADALYTEIPMGTEAQMSLMPMMIRKDGKTLNESIGPELSAALNEELKTIQPALDSTPFQSLKTWAVMATLPMLKSQLEGHQPLDTILWEKAKTAGKDQLGIETAVGQIEIFERFTEEESVKMLAESLAMLKDDRKAGISSIDNLAAAYASGDTAKLEAELNRSEQRMKESENKALGERFLKMLITDRNISMAETIDKQLRIDPSRSLFFAVGAGHLVGKDPINDHLAKKGYTITRVQD
jgi:uncharacterized protein YbaP (TraB family)